MLWILFSILAALIWAVVNIIDKYVLSKLISKPIIPLIIMGFIGLFASLLVFIFLDFQRLSVNNILLALISGFLYVLAAFFYFHAVKIEEISKVVPLFYLTPVFILFIVGIFLGEIFTPIKYFGIILLILGAILISTNKLFLISFSRAFWFMILASLLLAVDQIITKYLLGFADFWTIFAYIRVGAFIALVPAIAVNGDNFKTLYKKKGLWPFILMSLNEAFNLLAVLFITVATAIGFVTLVNALSSVRSFFVLLFTVLISFFYPQILKEKIGKSIILVKLSAIAMMFFGAILVSFG